MKWTQLKQRLCVIMASRWRDQWVDLYNRWPAMRGWRRNKAKNVPHNKTF